jgi:hypothetical protein
VGCQLGRLGPLNRSAGLLVGRTHLSGTAVSLVGGDPGVPMSHTVPSDPPTSQLRPRHSSAPYD